ncbi:MAG: hypothetical protein ACOYOA_00670 [Saprospiraceae bacterium]
MKLIKIVLAILFYLFLYLFGAYAIPEIFASFDVKVIPFIPIFITWGLLCLYLLMKRIKKINPPIEKTPES